MRKISLILIALIVCALVGIFQANPVSAGASTTTLYPQAEVSTLSGFLDLSEEEPNDSGYYHIDNTPVSWKLMKKFVMQASSMQITQILNSTYTFKVRNQAQSGGPRFNYKIEMKILRSDGTLRNSLGSWSSGTNYGTGSWKTYTYQGTLSSNYSIVEDTDYVAFIFYVKSETGAVYWHNFRYDNTADSTSLNTQILQFRYTGGPPPKYYFNFDWADLDNNLVDSHVTWQLHNASGQVSYNKGEATLTSGIYTLKPFRHSQLINSTTLDTSAQGNSTITINLQMKYHTHRANAYVTSNNTISSITIHEQTSINLTFTISGHTPALLIIDVAGNPDNATKDGSPFTNYTYYTSPAKHVRIEANSFSTFSFTWDQPPEEDTGVIPSSGAVGGNPWNIKLWVTVYYQGEILHMANVSIENSRTLWKLTDIFGMSKFRLPKGTYKVKASHEDYGSVEQDVLLEDHMEIDMDIAKGSPLSVFPNFDFGDFELGVLVLPAAIFVIYAFTLALRKPKRKYRYSYLS